MGDSGKATPHQAGEAPDKPLLGKTVMLTRPVDQSAEMAVRLQSLGAAVVHFPTIAIAPPTTWEELDSAIDRLERYNWIIFTSANGASSFFARLTERRTHGLAVALGIKTCAVGPATARAIARVGGRIDITADDSRAEGVVAAIVEHLGGESAIAGLSILLPRARVAREVLPEELRRYGAEVDAVEAYQTIRPPLEGEKLFRWLSDGDVDAVVFTSPSTVTNFASLLELDDLSDLLRGIVVASIGPVTTEAIHRFGITGVAQPAAYNGDALVDTLVDSLRS